MVVVVLGSMVLDQRLHVVRFPPVAGRTPATRYTEDLGGPAAVASATVARLGGTARFLGCRGDDEAGERAARHLREYGVDTTDMRVCPGAHTPVSAVLIAPDGERAIFAYPGFGLLDDADRLPLDVLDGAGAVLVDVRWPAAAVRFAAAARQRDIPVVVDLDTDERAAWDIASLGTHVIADETLAASCGGPEAALDRLAAIAPWSAVTLGASGVVYRGGRLPAFRVTAVDTTGAGDVFHGAFALGLAEGRSAGDSLVLASAAAALRCALGRVPERREVDELLRRAGKGAEAR